MNKLTRRIVLGLWLAASVAWIIAVIHIGGQSRQPFVASSVGSWFGYAGMIFGPILGLPIIIFATLDVLLRFVKTLRRDFMPHALVELIRRRFR